MNTQYSNLITNLLENWGKLWDVPDLTKSLSVVFSPRLRRSLGRCRPSNNVIRLNPVLKNTVNAHLLPEVLCHEAAHIAAFMKFGDTIKPHGPEWQQLIEAGGFQPRASLPEQLVEGLPKSQKRTKYCYEHKCTDCGAIFITSPPNQRWRCQTCLSNGLEGLLVVMRRFAKGGRG